MPKTVTSFANGNRVAEKHGLSTFEHRGPAGLAPANVDRLVELRALVRSEPGRRELREELLVRVALLAEMGFARLREEHEAGRDIWATDVIRRLATYVAEARRMLDTFPADDTGTSAADIITAEMAKYERHS